MEEVTLNTDEFVKWRGADTLIDKFHTYQRLCRMTEENRPKLMLELNKFSLNFGPVPLTQSYRETWLIDRLLAASNWCKEQMRCRNLVPMRREPLPGEQENSFVNHMIEFSVPNSGSSAEDPFDAYMRGKDHVFQALEKLLGHEVYGALLPLIHNNLPVGRYEPPTTVAEETK